jgi:hypothetical protein
MLKWLSLISRYFIFAIPVTLPTDTSQMKEANCHET